ncbi:YPL033C [Saccharomyces arboricola H-6]|uniref:YPL033C n=1 Tax=Saccharomyces arboricola (strain H-6 / AS 2.3317 / CBS 10644) TaxID=1160507 RepID=J8PGX7_SACAR|nr:YPL033C [Saccharomyces arboricola H-6]
MTETIYKIFLSFYERVGLGKKFHPRYDTVLIIGGSSNKLGIEICKMFIEKYDTRIINMDIIDNITGKKVRSESELYKFILCKDFSDIKCVEKSMHTLQSLKIYPTILINNMQEGLDSTFLKEDQFLKLNEESLCNFEKIVRYNLQSVILITKFCISSLFPKAHIGVQKDTKKFYIVNISTVLTLNESKSGTHFITSKCGINSFHDGLTSELKSKGSHLNVKTLLAYLPDFQSHEHWEMLCPTISEQLVRCLINGRYGDTILESKRSTGDILLLAGFKNQFS